MNTPKRVVLLRDIEHVGPRLARTEVALCEADGVIYGYDEDNSPLLMCPPESLPRLRDAGLIEY
jgi:hypothetical protein